MNATRWLLSCAALLCAVTVAGAAVTYPCPRLAVAPVVDGQVVGDPAWENAPVVTGFSVLGGGYTAAKQTLARLGWDEQALYVAVECEEPDAALLAPRVQDGGSTWREDSIELFFQPLAGGQTYQLGVTAGGAKGSGAGNPDISVVRAAARRGEEAYSVEVAIPWAVVQITPQAGSTLSFNICRNIFTTRSGGDKFTSWASLKQQFNEPASFARLLLQADPGSPEQARAAGEQLNAPYRADLLARLRQLATHYPLYRDTISQAAGHAKFGGPAAELQKDWEIILRLSRAGDRAGTLPLREALLKAQTLVQSSYELKFRFLIDELLEKM
jgi:hypothetical protein